MNIEKIIYTGVLSYIIIIVNRTLEFMFNLNLYNTDNLAITLLYLLSSIFTFISFYSLCSFTDKSSIAGKINLIAVFSIIPMLAFDCVNILSCIIKSFDSLYTRSILYAASSCFSCILFAIFIVGVHKYRVSPKISKSYNTLIIFTCLLTVSAIINSTITISIGSFYNITLVVYIIKTIVFAFMILNYKQIVTEMIKIANNNIDEDNEDDYLRF